MAVTEGTLEDLAAWCWQAPILADAREAAWSAFFGDDDPRPVQYWPGTEDITTRKRRFLGYFLFRWRLPSGQFPAEAAAAERYAPPFRDEVLTALTGARYVLAALKSIVGRSIYLQVGAQELEVRSLTWSRILRPGLTVAAHVVPVRHGHWVPGPGWVSLPIEMTERASATMTSADLDPVSLERTLQSRPEGDEPHETIPEDDRLSAAIERMTLWARDNGKAGLIRRPTAWRAHVRKHLEALDAMAFFQEVLARAGDVNTAEQANEIVGLASNIWNNTPNPDRGSRSPRELVKLSQEPPSLRSGQPPSPLQSRLRGKRTRDLELDGFDGMGE